MQMEIWHVTHIEGVGFKEGICYLTSLVLKSPKHTSLNIKTGKKKKKKKRFVLDCKPPLCIVIRSIKLAFFSSSFFYSVYPFLSSLWLLNGSVLTIILALLGLFGFSNVGAVESSSRG